MTADIPVGLTGARPLRKPARARSRRPANRAAIWGAYGFITPAILAAALLPDNGTAWHAFGPIAFFYFIGWLIIGIMMLASWRGLYGIIMPSAITIAVVPGYTIVRAFVVTAAIIYSTFWLSGGILTLGLRLGWSRRLGWKLR